MKSLHSLLVSQEPRALVYAHLQKSYDFYVEANRRSPCTEHLSDMPSHLFGCECLVVHLFLAIQGFNGRGDGKKLAVFEGDTKRFRK